MGIKLTRGEVVSLRTTWLARCLKLTVTNDALDVGEELSRFDSLMTRQTRLDVNEFFSEPLQKLERRLTHLRSCAGWRLGARVSTPRPRTAGGVSISLERTLGVNERSLPVEPGPLPASLARVPVTGAHHWAACTCRRDRVHGSASVTLDFARDRRRENVPLVARIPVDSL